MELTVTFVLNMTFEIHISYDTIMQINNCKSTLCNRYNGSDNNDYVNGQGFCCSDNAVKAPALRAMQPNDNPEKLQFYYHSDHLGSTSLITDLDGNVAQHIEYIPYGEVFIEERNNTWNTPYKFNGKELDEETGLYYYGARYYDPRVSVWLGVDPVGEKYQGISVYTYCMDNPVNAVDPDGEKIVFLIRDHSGKITNYLTYHNGNFWHINGDRYDPGKESISKTMYKALAAYRKIENSKDETLTKYLHILVNSSKIHYVEEGKQGEGSEVLPYEPTKTVSETEKMIKNKESVGTHTSFDFSKEWSDEFKKSTGVPNSNFSTVVHEMQHQYDYDQGKMADDYDTSPSAKSPAEIRAVNLENKARKIENMKKRTNYGGENIDPKKLK